MDANFNTSIVDSSIEAENPAPERISGAGFVVWRHALRLVLSAMMVGIGLASLWYWKHPYSLIIQHRSMLVAGWATVVAAMGAVVSSVQAHRFRSTMLLLLAVVAGCVVGGARFTIALADHRLPYATDRIVRISGEVVERIDRYRSSAELTVTTSDQWTLWVTVTNAASIHLGDRVTLMCRVEPVPDDGTNTTPWRPRLRALVHREAGTCAGAQIIEHRSGVPTLLRDRWHLIDHVHEHLLPPADVLVSAMLLGDRSSLSRSMTQDFISTGTIHLLVVSGGNITLMILFLSRLLGWCPRRARIVILAIAVMAVPWMIGWSAPVTRAIVMALLTLGGLIAGRPRASLWWLVLAAGVMVWIHPLILMFDLGFQLSILSTAGILIGWTMMRASGLTDRWDPESFKGYGVTAIMAWIATLPLLWAATGSVSLIGPVINALVACMVDVITGSALLLALVWWLPSHFIMPLALFVQSSSEWFLWFIHYGAQIPYASQTLPLLPYWIMFSWYVVVGWIVYRGVLRHHHTVD